MPHQNTLLLIFLLLSVSSSVAIAQEPVDQEREKAKKLFQAAEIYYQAGNYQEALSNYKNSYELSKEPLLIFNMAQCYRQMGNYKEALKTYKRFLEEDPNSSIRTEAEQFISELSRENSLNTTVATQDDVKESKPKKLLLPSILGLGSISFGLSSLMLKNNAKQDGFLLPEEKQPIFILAAVSDVCLLAAGVTLLRAVTQKTPQLSLHPSPSAPLVTYTPWVKGEVP